MYTVWMFDAMDCTDVCVFAGTLPECLSYVDGDKELYIQLPDGFSVYEG